MPNKTSVDGLSAAVENQLRQYGAMVSEEIKSAVKRAGETVKQEIQQNAPRDTGAYAKSWTTKTTNETNHSLTVTVHSKNRYQLTHLLEYGHAKRNGSRVEARPHIASAERKGIQQLEKEIKEKIANG